MKLRIVLSALLLGFLAQAPLLSVLRAEEGTVDRILVFVNDEIITESDLQQALQPIAARIRATTDPALQEDKITEIRKRILEQMIDDRLLTSAARAMKVNDKGLEVKEEEVDDMLEDMRKKFPSEEAFDEVLREQRLSYKKLRDRFKDELLRSRAIDFKVRARVNVSPGEVSEYYNRNKDAFRGPAEARVKQILIRSGSIRSEEAAKELAQSIREKLIAGGDMAALAREYSEGSEKENGGDMGWVKQGQFLERLDRAIFKLGPGEVSEAVKTQLGFHLFKSEESRPAELLGFEDVRDKIQSLLLKKKSADLLKAWLEELRKDAYITRKD